MNNTQRPGYILVVALMIIGLSVVLVTYVTFKASAYTPFAQAMVDREKATQLALSGVQVACAQLAQEPKKQQETAEEHKHDQAQAEGNSDRDLLKMLLPIKNQWQKFTLKKARDGVNGTIEVCIVSEYGKIDINALYDFKKHDFNDLGAPKGEAKKTLELLFDRIKQQIGGENLFPAFEKFLKERQYKLHDVTELLTIKEFELFKRNVFYEPPEQKSMQAPAQKRPIYLTDIFTVWADAKINPWLISDSLSALLDLKRADGNEHPAEEFAESIKKFKSSLVWPADWDLIFAPLYGKQFASLPKGSEYYLNTKFETSTFSVLSYGNVGKFTQKIMAIVERIEAENAHVEVIIKKLYWL